MATTEPAVTATTDLANAICTVMPMVVDHVGHRLEEFGMTRTDYWALQNVDQPTPMKDIAAMMDIDPSYVTLVADRLEELGLIERQPDPNDRRVKNLVITPAGAKLKQTIPNLLWDGPTLFSGLSPKEQTQITSLLRKVISGQDSGTD